MSSLFPPQPVQHMMSPYQRSRVTAVPRSSGSEFDGDIPRQRLAQISRLQQHASVSQKAFKFSLFLSIASFAFLFIPVFRRLIVYLRTFGLTRQFILSFAWALFFIGVTGVLWFGTARHRQKKQIKALSTKERAIFGLASGPLSSTIPTSPLISSSQDGNSAAASSLSPPSSKVGSLSSPSASISSRSAITSPTSPTSPADNGALGSLNWSISNFSSNRLGVMQSEDFKVGGVPFHLRCTVSGDQLNLFVRISHDFDIPSTWKLDSQMSFSILNQINRGSDLTKRTHHVFDNRSTTWGFEPFCSLSELQRYGGFLVDDCLFFSFTIHQSGGRLLSSFSSPLSKRESDFREALMSPVKTPSAADANKAAVAALKSPRAPFSPSAPSSSSATNLFASPSLVQDERYLEQFIGRVSQRAEGAASIFKSEADSLSQIPPSAPGAVSSAPNGSMVSFTSSSGFLASIMPSSITSPISRLRAPYRLSPAPQKAPPPPPKKNDDLGNEENARRDLEALKLAVQAEYYVENARKWFRTVVLQPLLTSIDDVDRILSSKQYNCSAFECGYALSESTDQRIITRRDLLMQEMAKTRTDPKYLVLGAMLEPKLRTRLALEEYLDVPKCSSRAYILNRMRELATSGILLPAYRWDSGGNNPVDGTPWNAAQLPTDAALCAHLLCTFLNEKFPPYPGDSGRGFSSRYFMVKGQDVNTKRLLYLYQTSQLPPHFKVVISNRQRDCAPGSNNFWMAIVLFVSHVHSEQEDKIGNFNLASVGLSGILA